MRAMSGGGRWGTCPSLQERGRGQDLNRSGAINNIRTISNCKKGKGRREGGRMGGWEVVEVVKGKVTRLYHLFLVEC